MGQSECMSLGVCDEQEGGKREIGALFIFACLQMSNTELQKRCSNDAVIPD